MLPKLRNRATGCYRLLPAARPTLELTTAPHSTLPPTPGPAGLPFTEAGKALGAAWRDAAGEVQAVYKERAAERKAQLLAAGLLQPAGAGVGDGTMANKPKTKRFKKAVVEGNDEEGDDAVPAEDGAADGDADDEDAGFARKKKKSKGGLVPLAKASASSSSGGSGGLLLAPKKKKKASAAAALTAFSEGDAEEEEGDAEEGDSGAAASSGGGDRAYFKTPVLTAKQVGGGNKPRKTPAKRGRSGSDSDGSDGEREGDGPLDESEVFVVADPRADAIAAAAAAVKEGRVAVSVKDGFITGSGSYEAPEADIVPRMTGRVNYKPYVFLRGDAVALVVPAWEEFAGANGDELAALEAAGYAASDLSRFYGECTQRQCRRGALIVMFLRVAVVTDLDG